MRRGLVILLVLASSACHRRHFSLARVCPRGCPNFSQRAAEVKWQFRTHHPNVLGMEIGRCPEGGHFVVATNGLYAVTDYFDAHGEMIGESTAGETQKKISYGRVPDCADPNAHVLWADMISADGGDVTARGATAP